MGPHADADDVAVALEDLALPRADGKLARTEDSVHPDLVFWNVSDKPCPVYLWGDGQGDKGRYSIVAHSPRIMVMARGDELELSSQGKTLRLRGSAMPILESLLASSYEPGQGLPFEGGAIGYISYEQACHDALWPTREGPLPGLCFGLYDTAYVYDHEKRSGYWLGTPTHIRRALPSSTQLSLSEWTPSVRRPEYLRHVEMILDCIARGDLYQANYTRRLTASGTVDAPALALEFRRRLSSPLGAYLGFPKAQVWSLSPERLLSGERGCYLESRPIKGTRRRDPSPASDRALSLDLYHDPKDRSELLMIVDLVRNDLGRVASTGSVVVAELFGRQTYTNVHHLEAIVKSDFPKERSWTEALRAVLPGGSVTGTPKRAAVELLARLEPVPRSVYTGALGYWSYNGRADFNLPIRTLYHDEQTFYLHSGGGVVADSDPVGEFDESEVKISHILELLHSL